MNSGMIGVFVIIFSISIIIYVVKNNEELIKNKKYKIVMFFLFFMAGGILSFFTVKELIKIPYSIDSFISYKNTQKEFDIFDENLKKEKELYSNSIKKEYEDNYMNPYIFEGFKYVEGEWDTGFVIEDENGNQFVWVPVSNKEEQNVAKLLKKDFIINPIIGKEYCLDDNYEQFLSRTLENGGFYISRYETGIENEKIVSKPGKELLTNLTKDEMVSKINEMYETNNFTCELINGYAYDTVIEWIKQNQSITNFKCNIDSKVLTGRNSINNIYDLFDNVFEYTR